MGIFVNSFFFALSTIRIFFFFRNDKKRRDSHYLSLSPHTHRHLYAVCVCTCDSGDDDDGALSRRRLFRPSSHHQHRGANRFLLRMNPTPFGCWGFLRRGPSYFLGCFGSSQQQHRIVRCQFFRGKRIGVMCGEETTIILRLHLFITFHIQQQIEWKTDTQVKKDKLFLFLFFSGFLLGCRC